MEALQLAQTVGKLDHALAKLQEIQCTLRGHGPSSLPQRYLQQRGEADDESKGDVTKKPPPRLRKFEEGHRAPSILDQAVAASATAGGRRRWSTPAPLANNNTMGDAEAAMDASRFAKKARDMVMVQRKQANRQQKPLPAAAQTTAMNLLHPSNNKLNTSQPKNMDSAAPALVRHGNEEDDDLGSGRPRRRRRRDTSRDSHSSKENQKLHHHHRHGVVLKEEDTADVPKLKTKKKKQQVIHNERSSPDRFNGYGGGGGGDAVITPRRQPGEDSVALRVLLDAEAALDRRNSKLQVDGFGLGSADMRRRGKEAEDMKAEMRRRRRRSSVDAVVEGQAKVERRKEEGDGDGGVDVPAVEAAISASSSEEDEGGYGDGGHRFSVEEIKCSRVGSSALRRKSWGFSSSAAIVMFPNPAASAACHETAAATGTRRNSGAETPAAFPVMAAKTPISAAATRSAQAASAAAAAPAKRRVPVGAVVDLHSVAEKSRMIKREKVVRLAPCHTPGGGGDYQHHRRSSDASHNLQLQGRGGAAAGGTDPPPSASAHQQARRRSLSGVRPSGTRRRSVVP